LIVRTTLPAPLSAPTSSLTVTFSTSPRVEVHGAAGAVRSFAG
jgi:hypothetical protein